MFCHYHPDKEAHFHCTHCWAPVCEYCIRTFRGKGFCSLACVLRYYWCTFSLFIGARAKRTRLVLFQRKGWSAGLAAGLLLSLGLLIFLVMLLFTPGSRHSRMTPLTETTVDATTLIPPFLFHPPAVPPVKPLPSRLIDRERVEGLSTAKEREIKDGVRIEEVREYPLGPQQSIGISGQASSGSICALYLNGTLYEAATCQKGRFFFPRITLARGRNSIEVIAHNPDGYIVPSNTIDLFLDPNMRLQEKGRDITRGSTDNPYICLTFDGDASASCAPEIMKTLKRYGIRCTFFLTGDFIRNHPEMVKEMVAEGHEIGNHTDAHPHLARLTQQMRFSTLPWVTKEFLHNQIKKAEMAFFQLTGKRMTPIWRAPYGEHTPEILRWAEEIGYTHISWTCGRVLEEGLDSLDWVYNETSPIYYSSAEIRDKIIHFGEENPEGAKGGIVLMHLATSRPLEDRIHRQLPAIIEGLLKRGYQLKTIGEMTRTSPVRQAKKQERDFGRRKKLRQSRKGKG